MKITNLKRFEKIVKTLAKFDKWHKKNPRRPFNSIIYFSEGKLYVTQGQVMGIIDVSDCVDFSEREEFVFPSDMAAKKSVGKDIEGNLVADGKRVDCEQIDARFYKRVIPKDDPTAELSLDFSKYGNLDVGYDKSLAFAEINSGSVVLNYKDYVGTVCTIEDCFSDSDCLLDFGDFGDFKSVRFLLQWIFQILKISKKIVVKQYEKSDSAHKIIAGAYEFLIMPLKF